MPRGWSENRSGIHPTEESPRWIETGTGTPVDYSQEVSLDTCTIRKSRITGRNGYTRNKTSLFRLREPIIPGKEPVYRPHTISVLGSGRLTVRKDVRTCYSVGKIGSRPSRVSSMTGTSGVIEVSSFEPEGCWYGRLEDRPGEDLREWTDNW